MLEDAHPSLHCPLSSKVMLLNDYRKNMFSVNLSVALMDSHNHSLFSTQLPLGRQGLCVTRASRGLKSTVSVPFTLCCDEWAPAVDSNMEESPGNPQHV